MTADDRILADLQKHCAEEVRQLIATHMRRAARVIDSRDATCLAIGVAAETVIFAAGFAAIQAKSDDLVGTTFDAFCRSIATTVAAERTSVVAKAHRTRAHAADAMSMAVGGLSR